MPRPPPPKHTVNREYTDQKPSDYYKAMIKALFEYNSEQHQVVSKKLILVLKKLDHNYNVIKRMTNELLTKQKSTNEDIDSIYEYFNSDKTGKKFIDTLDVTRQYMYIIWMYLDKHKDWFPFKNTYFTVVFEELIINPILKPLGDNITIEILDSMGPPPTRENPFGGGKRKKSRRHNQTRNKNNKKSTRKNRKSRKNKKKKSSK